ncbi:MAG: hypothetical protein IT184_17310 [Acidobacteria bacterium]|nr:hypothetical protein [Acidobacteriota bacterium]
MSPRARRAGAASAVASFEWRPPAQPAPKAAPTLIAVAFASPGVAADAVADPRHETEAREIQLPSVSTEHLRAVEEEAYARGHARGLEAAETDAARAHDEARARLAAALEDLAGLRVGLMRRAERELVELAVAIAERVIRRELEIDPDLLQLIARVAIDRLGERASAVVHLNPADHRRLSAGDALGGIDLVADPDVPAGGCLVVSPSGEINAGIEAQVREISRELIGGDGDEAPRDVVAAR